MRVLLVDDDVYTLDILTTLFKKTMQVEVLALSTKKEAIDALEQEDFLFIVTDIKLNDGDGFEVLSKAKQKNVLTPVIGITGYVDEIEDTYMSINFDLLIRKPIRFQEFLQKLNETNNKFFQVFFYSSLKEFKEASPEHSRKKMVIFVTEEYAYEVQEYLNEKGIDAYGVVLPGFIYRSRIFESGIMTMFISDRAKDIKLYSAGELMDSGLKKATSHLMYYDACTLNLEYFCGNYERMFGGSYVLGIGCGDKYLKKGSALFDKEGFHEKSCLIISTSRRLYSESYLGLKIEEGPLDIKLTKNIISKINGMDACEYYKSFYNTRESKDVSSIYEMGIRYPFGFIGEDNKLTARVPVESSEGGIGFIGKYDNATSYILHYDKEEAVAELEKLLKDFRVKEKIEMPVITYCYGRYTGNKNEFSLSELEKIFKYFPDSNFGFFSHGEVVNIDSDKHKMLNYSIILSNFEV